MQKIWAGHGSDQGCFRQPSIIQCTNQLLGDLLPHSLVKILHGLCLIAFVASIMEVLSRQSCQRSSGMFLERCSCDVQRVAICADECLNWHVDKYLFYGVHWLNLLCGDR